MSKSESTAVPDRIATGGRASRGFPRWSLEAALLFGALLVLDRAHVLPLAASEGALHPFWIPVVLFSCVYGTMQGLGTALVATALFHWLAQTPVLPAMDYYGWLLAVWLEPMLWLVTALVLGEIRRHSLDEREHLGELAASREAQAQTLAGHCDRLRSHVALLEHRIVTRETPLSERALAAIAPLCASSLDSLETDGLGVVAQLLGASSAQLLTPGARAWKLAAETSPGRRPPEDGVNLGAEALDAIAAERRILCAADAGDARLLGGSLAAAVPVISTLR